MAEKPRTDKAAAADVTLALGFASVGGDLYTIPVANAKEAESLHSVCPDCETPQQFMGAALVCKDNAEHGPFVKGQIKMGKEVGDKIVVVDTNAVKEARASVLPKNTLNLQVHKREEVEANTFPMGNAYVFTPKGSGLAFYSVIVELLKKRRDVCLIAPVNLRKTDHLVMLDLEMNGQLVVRELIWPEDMKQFAPVAEPQITQKERAKLVAQAETLLDVSTEPFVKDDYKKESKVKVAQVIQDAASGTSPSPKAAAKKASKETADTLAEQIEAAIAARRAS